MYSCSCTRCLFIDERSDFFSLLSAKLGSGFEFVQGRWDELTEEVLGASDAIILSLPLADAPNYKERLQRLDRLAANPAGVPVVVFLPLSERSLMLDAMGAGAYDCFVETASMGELGIVLRRAAQFFELRRELAHVKATSLDQPAGFGSILTADANTAAMLRFAAKIASSDANVLITGETGTGKEVLARAIHEASLRAARPFQAVACSSLPETLIEAELFGHEKGAFTGAVAMRRGRFEAAERGTIFLDEVGELTPGLQVKLLRVLQERKFERLGSNQQRPMEARIICATHRGLGEMMTSGAFRADLYYRLNTIEIPLPALRQRPDDIPLLANHFIQRHVQHHHRPARRIAPAAMGSLIRYQWPGNIRELEHAIEHAVVLCDGPEIQLEHLPAAVRQLPLALPGSVEPDLLSFEREVRRFKRQLVQKGLERCRNNKVRAAQLLHISRSSLHRLIQELGIEEPARLAEGDRPDPPEHVTPSYLA